MKQRHIPTAKEVATRLGGYPALAEAAGVDRTTPYSWTIIPAERVAAIVKATEMTAAELRPDLAKVFRA